MAQFPAIDLKALSDDDAIKLTAGANAPARPSGPIDISKLSDDAVLGLTKGTSAEPVGLMESFGRGAIEGATFGFDDEIGVDKARREASQKANPWTHFMGELAGSVLPMAAATAIPTGVGQAAAAGRAATLGGKAMRLVRGALVPGEASTLGQSIGQGMKLGTSYGAIAGAGHAEPKEGDSLSEAVIDRGIGALKGGATGLVLGGPLGAAGYGASRAIGAALNRSLPELKDVMAAASAPEMQGIRDVVRQAGYDKYTIADFAALRDKLRDPTQAHRYADLNLIEALETAPLKPLAGTGELKPPVVTSPNLRDMAQDFANTGGQGRQQAVDAFASRKNEMSAKIQGDIDRLFGGEDAAPSSRLFGAPGKAADAEALPVLVDRHFGSGAREIDDAAMLAQKEALGKRYDRLRSKPLQQVDEIGAYAQAIPEFRAAIEYAAKNDMIQTVAGGKGDAAWTRPWSAYLSDMKGPIPTLSPTNILDIHHALVLNAKPGLTGPTPESMMAGKLKNWFSNWVDTQFRGHKDLREDYSVFKRTMEAQDFGAKLPINGGGLDHPSLKFLTQATKDLDASASALEKRIAAYDAAMAKYEAGGRKTQPPVSNLKSMVDKVEAKQSVIEAFRKSWGENWKQELARSTDPEAVIQKALTPEGQRRIIATLGEKEGAPFLNSLLVMDARSQGRSLGMSAGGADHTALRFFDKAVREGRTDVANAFRQAWGERIKQELASATAGTNGVVSKLLTQEGKDRILRILGPENGKEFIETLYNKSMQNGFSRTLFGGPDTAYKLARNRKTDALMDAVYGLAHLRPMQTLKSLGEIGSSAYKQRRADQGNELLSQQGVEKVGDILDSILARHQLTTTGHPFVLKPALKGIGPYSATLPAESLPSPDKPGLKPYRP